MGLQKSKFLSFADFFKNQKPGLFQIPFFIEAENQIDEKSLFELASLISTMLRL
jgi:hypothetical protein